MKTESDDNRPKCEACDGKGWYATGPTDHAVQLQCRFCSGTGVRPVMDADDLDDGGSEGEW